MALRGLQLLMIAMAAAALTACAPPSPAQPGGNQSLSSTDPGTGGGETPPPNDPGPPPVQTPPAQPPPMTAPPPPVARPSSAANLKVCPLTTDLKGVDVSDYDPGTNWPTLKTGGHSFAIIKATEGNSYVNPLFKNDWAAAKAAGVIRGAYHFYHAGDNPTTQANEFIKTMGQLEPDDMAPVFDWETNEKTSTATAIANAKIFLDAVQKATGRVPVIYTGTSFWNSMGNPAYFIKYPLYLAEYEVSCPNVPPPWSKWTMWQNADTGGVSGITTKNVDQDYFAGTMDELIEFVAAGWF